MRNSIVNLRIAKKRGEPTCNGNCESCPVKLLRIKDETHKLDVDGELKKYIKDERKCIEKLKLNWTIRRYCPIDGYNDDIIVDIKSKPKETYQEYKHGLGLIIKERETTIMEYLRAYCGYKHSFFIYNYKDQMKAVPSTVARKLGEAAPITSLDNKFDEIFYVPFNLWMTINSLSDLMSYDYSALDVKKCRVCGMYTYKYHDTHKSCQISQHKQKIKIERKIEEMDFTELLE